MKPVTLFFSVFFLALLIVNFGATYSYGVLEKEILEEKVLEHLETTAQSRVNHINEFLSKQKKIVKIAATHKELSYEELQKIRDTTLAFSEVFVMDSSGKIIASSDLSIIGKDKSDNIYFIEGKKDTYIKDIHYSETLDESALTVLTPFNKGVLIARINLEVLTKIVSDRTGLGETGETYLINKDGYMTTSSRFLSDEETFLNEKIDTKNSRACLEDLEEYYVEEEAEVKEHKKLVSYLDYRGEEVFGTHAHVLEMKWCLLAKIDKSEISNKIRGGSYIRLLITSLVVTLGVTLASLLFWVIILRRKRNILSKKRKKIKYNKKKIVLFIVIGLLIVGLIVGLFAVNKFFPNLISSDTSVSGGTLSKELNVYNWEGYLDENDSLLNDFEKEFGVKVNLYTYDSEEKLLDSIENYEGFYDVIFAVDSKFKQFISEDKFEKLNKKNIPNLNNVDSNFKNPGYNSNWEYGVPYLWGTTGLVINTKYVPEDTDSYEVLWNPKYEGKIGVMMNEGELFGMVAKYVGSPRIITEIRDLRNINDFLKLQKELVGEYKDAYTIISEMASEDLWLANTWSVDAGAMMEANPNIKYIIPKEGASKWVEYIAIPKGSKNKYTAEVFIDYIHRPDIYARIANYQSTPGVNIPAREFIDKSILENKAFNVPDEEWDKLYGSDDFDLSKKILNKRKEMWDELMEK